MYSSWPLSGSGGRAGGGLATSAVVQCLIDAQSDKAQTGTENPLDIREKIGRTSGVTSGICHGPKAVCDWHGATRRNEKGQAMDLEVYRTEEFIVINKKLTESEFEQSDFTANGDSGSFVLDEDGVVNGLLFAEVRNNHGLAGVVMSMADVLESIRLKLGGDVVIEDHPTYIQREM